MSDTDDLDNQLSAEQQSQADELAKAYREVIAMQSGKLVLFDILSRCSIYAEPFAGENHAVTAHALGKQAVGRDLIGMLDSIDPRMYPQLLFDVADLKAMEKAVREASAKTEDDDDAP